MFGRKNDNQQKRLIASFAVSLFYGCFVALSHLSFTAPQAAPEADFAPVQLC